MKKVLFAVFTIVILASCSQKDITEPETQISGNVFYKDANVAIADVKAKGEGNALKLQFSSLYEKNVAKMEIMSGPYENMLCFIHEEPIASNSLQRKNYNITENNANTDQRYYVIKYTLKSGGWILTPAFKYTK